MSQVVEEFAGMDLRLVQSVDQLTEMLVELEKHEAIAFDVEANGKHYMAGDFKVVGVSFAVSAYRGWYVPINHHFGDAVLIKGEIFQMPEWRVVQLIRPLLEKHKLIGHNIKYDYQAMRRLGVKLKIYFDTMIASWVLDERKPRQGLKWLVKNELGRDVIEIKDIIGDKSYDFGKVKVEDAPKYAAADACNTFAFYQRYTPQINRENGLSTIFWRIEMPCVEVTAEMERKGIVLDENRVEEMWSQLTPRMEEAKTKLAGIADREVQKIKNSRAQSWRQEFEREFNPAYEHDMPLLCHLMGLTKKRKKSDGKKFDAALVEKLLGRNLNTQQTDMLETLKDWKKVTKFRSTYTRNLLEKVVSTTGRIHPSFLQSRTNSGRFASRNPNGQNLPREAGDWDVRRAFTCAPGHVLVLADYDAMEIRLTAALSRCPVLTAIVLKRMLFNEETGELKKFETAEAAAEALENGWIGVDMHKFTASNAFKVKYSEVTKDQRQKAKPVNFGIIYGVSKFGLSDQLGVSQNEAQEFIDGFFRSYPGVYTWIEETKKRTFLVGYAQTAYGRRRRIPHELWEEKKKDPDWKELEQAGVFREAVNHCVQGTGADVMKMAMRRMYDAFIRLQLPAWLVGQIHDEGVTETTIEAAPTVAKVMEEEMSTELFGIPLPAEPEFKLTWSKEEQDLSAYGL